MGSGRRQALDMALNTDADVITWIEPEKHTLIAEIYKLADPIFREGADITVPNRGPLDSYPIAQQHAEYVGNLFFEQLTGKKLDMWSGPRAMNPESVSFFTDYDGTKEFLPNANSYGDKWDSIFIPVIGAILAGKDVRSIDVDYKHPGEQTADENMDPVMTFKRVNQLDNLVNSMMDYYKKNT